MNFLQFLLKLQFDLLRLDHDGLLALDHLEIQLLDVLVDLDDAGRVNEHHVIHQFRHLLPVLPMQTGHLLFVHRLRLDLQQTQGAVFNAANQVGVVMAHFQLLDRQVVDMTLLIFGQLEMVLFGVGDLLVDQMFLD